MLLPGLALNPTGQSSLLGWWAPENRWTRQLSAQAVERIQVRFPVRPLLGVVYHSRSPRENLHPTFTATQAMAMGVYSGGSFKELDPSTGLQLLFRYPCRAKPLHQGAGFPLAPNRANYFKRWKKA